MFRIDETHDPGLESWVDSANDSATDFPIQNLPFGRFRRAAGEGLRIGVAIGDRVLDLQAAGFVTDADMNALMASGNEAQLALRRGLSAALRHDSRRRSELARCLLAQDEVVLDLPCRIGDYTDFYTSIHHATNIGRLFRPDNPLLPNYRWVPIGYHGRASSIVPSGRGFRRPIGQIRSGDDATPRVIPTERLDYELELGAFVGRSNVQGESISMAAAESHLFGLALFNDWTARDMQAWEYQPLGPFLSKNFASALSPWIVTMDALAPFRAPFERPAGEPAPLPYLDNARNRESGAIDIQLEVWLQTQSMRASGQREQLLSRSNFRDSYWTLAQLVTHHTVNGCNLQPGDLLGSGTQSGPRPEQAGSLLELTAGGRKPLRLVNGETRSFLHDGDSVILRGSCSREGYRRIGFGECVGTALPPMVSAAGTT
jgi:fumarylacetoacetase